MYLIQMKTAIFSLKILPTWFLSFLGLSIFYKLK